MPEFLIDALQQEREKLLLTLSARLKAEQEISHQRRIAVGDLLGELPRLYDLICQTLRAESSDNNLLGTSTIAQQHGARRVEQGFEVGDLFREFSLLRSLIADIIRRHSSTLSRNETFDVLTQLTATTERLLYLAVNTHTHKQAQELSDQARRDPLTRLLNRATFDEMLRDEIERARRYERGLSLVLLDVDYFKQVNDRFGHQAGDEALQGLARIIQSSLRHSDTAFRYGGDEFAAICPETPGEMMESVMKRVEASVMSYFEDTPIAEGCGISWGIASFPGDETRISELLRIADERLYERKKVHHQQMENTPQLVQSRRR
jgi:diguanylate cyclase (GGDEF)-like protein